MSSAIVYVDGSVYHDEKRIYHAGCGWSIIDAGYGTEAGYGGKYLYSCDAMEAEFHAILCGLKATLDRKYRHVKVRSDSQTAVESIRCLDAIDLPPALRPLARRAVLLTQEANVSFEHVSRSQTKRAHKLAQMAAGITFGFEEEDRVLSAAEAAKQVKELQRLRRHFSRLLGPVSRRLQLGREDEVGQALMILEEYERDFSTIVRIIAADLKGRLSQR